MAKPMLSGFVPQQAHFEFFPVSLVRDLTDRNMQKLAKADLARSRALTRPRPARVVGEGAIAQIPLDLLDAPIEISAPTTRLGKPNQLVETDLGDIDLDDINVAGDESQGWTGEWSPQAMLQLHDAVLHAGLEALARRGNPNEKLEALKWFFLPDIRGWNKRTLPNGQTVYRPIDAINIPFSYRLCCAAAGLNHERLREGLIYILRKAGLGQYLPQ